MADIDNQTEEAMGWAAEGKKLAVNIPEVSLKDAATFVAEMTPIVGDVMAAKEVYDELQKDEPNYYLAGALGGAALIGLIPGVGDVAAKAIKKGAKEVFDVAKRVEVDTNAMGSGLGNVKLKPKDSVIKANPKAEMVSTSVINSTIPKGNKPRYDVGKIDTVADYNAEDWMYTDFDKTGKPTLKESIFKEGIKEPIEIMVSKKTGDMVLGEGNHRLKAATELGMDEVPVVVYVKDDLGFIDGEVPAKIDTKGLKSGKYYSLSEIDLDSRMIEGKKPAGQGSFQYLNKDGTFSAEPDPTRFTPMRDIGVNKQVSNIEFDARIAELDEAPDVSTWQANTKRFVKESRDVNPSIRTPELENSTKDLLDGKITREQHLKNIDEYKPVNAWDAMPREPSDKAVVFSLDDAQRKDGHFVLDSTSSMDVNKSSLKIGDLFNGRLDIPAYNRYDTWVVTGSSATAEKGKHYAKAVHYTAGEGKPVKFIASVKTGEKIGTGEKGKTPYATVQGYVKDLDADAIRAKATDYLNDPEWTQVGFDPRRQGGFYVRAGENKHVPIREANEVIQIGPLVLAKNAKLDFEYSGYNEGGLAMDDQTVRAFALGGLAEDVDPVSGNEVPVGSMPEEVRDDIPAQLSEGEYVVPADVVRFFGVKFFEDIRAEAKQGFAQMESTGRVGGEPMGMEVINPEDDIEFDESDFDIIDGPDGYAEGGDVSSTDAMAVLSGSGPKTMEMREFVNAAGNTITIMYFNGMPMSVIPEGYTEVAPEPVTSPGAPVTSTEVVNNSDDDSGVDLPENKPVNYKELSASELQAMVKDSKGMANSLIGGGALMINPIIGLSVKAAMWHQRKQVEKELVRRVEDDTIDPAIRTQYEELLQIAEEDTPGMWTRLFGTDRDKEKAGLGDFPFDPVSAEPEAIDDAVKEAMEYTPEDTTTITKDPLYRSPITGWQSAETNAEIAEVAAANAAISQAYVPEAITDARAERIADAKRRDKAEKKAELRKRAQQAQADINAQQSSSDNSSRNREDNSSRNRERAIQVESSRNKASANVAKSEGTTARTDSGGKETYSSKVKRGGGFSKGGLMKNKKK